MTVELGLTSLFTGIKPAAETAPSWGLELTDRQRMKQEGPAAQRAGLRS